MRNDTLQRPDNESPASGLFARPTRAKSAEKTVFWIFRLGTYFILLCASAIFLTIVVKGSAAVFKTSFPFVNTDFLTQAPQTLHVFDYQGEQREMSDSDFRVWQNETGYQPGTVHYFTYQGDSYALDDAQFASFQRDNDARIRAAPGQENEYGYRAAPYETYAYSGGGIFPAIAGTVLLVLGSMTIALTLGVLSAIYLSEYSRPGRTLNTIRLSILNLAGVPSVVFGIFGLGMFVLFLDWNVSLMAGWFTLAFMVLPIVISASEESLRAIPQGLREASLALGASKWTSIRTNVLPYAMPGILTSSIIGVARVAGETAPIMFTAAYAMRDQLPWEGLEKWTDFFFQGVMALPYHIYVVSSKIPQNEYTERMQYGTAFVFLVIVASIAMTSILLRVRMRNKYRW